MSRRRVTQAQLARLEHQLTERDRQIIQTLDRVRLASSRQLERLHFHGSSPASDARLARKRLARLCERRVLSRLSRQVGGVRAGSAAHVYALDVAGQHLAAGCGPAGGRRLRRPWTTGLPFMAHILGVCELYVRLVEAARCDLRTELLAFDAEPHCWRTFAAPGGGKAMLKPDAFCRVAVGDYEHISFVELDRATESATTIRRKLAVYRRYLQTGREEQRWGVFPRIVFVVPDEARKEVLVDVLGAEPADTWPLYAVTLEADAVTVLTGGTP